MGIADMLIGGYNSGRALAKDREAEAKKTRLGELLGQAYASGNPSAAMPEIARLAPESAHTYQQGFQGIEDSEREEFARTLQIFTEVMTPEQRAQAYPAIRQRISQRIPRAQYPEQWDEATMFPQAQKLRQVFVGQSQTPASVQELEYLLANPEARELDMARRRAPPAPQFHVDRDGNAYWLTPPSAGGPTASATAGAPAPTTGGGAQVMDSAYQGAIGNFGSLRDAVEFHESRGNPNAVSPAGAVGRMQTMPATLQDPGFGVQPARDQSDAERTRVGNEYLQAMLQKYGSPELALAAYNWGPGNVDRALQASGGDPAAVLASAPQETQQYVQNVMASAGGQGGPVVGPQAAPGGAILIPGFRGAPKGGANRVAQLSPDEVRALGLPAGTVAQRNEQTGAVSVIHKPPADKPPAGRKALSGDVANKVGLYDNAIRSAREWFDMVAEKDASGNFTGRYNNAAAMGPAAQSAFLNALRAKLRAESGAAISEGEVEGEAKRYAARMLGGDHVDLQNAARLLRDLVQQREMLVGSAPAPSDGGRYQVGQVIEKGGRKYRVVGGDMDDPDVEEI